jgi:hypothetical protein
MTTRNRLLAGIAIATLCLQPALAQETPAPAPEAPAAAPAAPAPYTPPAAAAPATETPAEAPAAAEPATPPAAAAPLVPDDVTMAIANLPTAIEDVQVVGPWIDGAKSGVWRTVMLQVGTTEKESYRFFVQQVEKVGGTSSVLVTTEIKEIPKLNGAIVGYRADEPSEEDATGLTLFFDMVPSDGEIAETYELHFQPDQTYTFGPATN